MTIRFLPEIQEIVQKMTLEGATRASILNTLKNNFGKAYRPTDLSQDMAMYKGIELKIDKEKYTKKQVKEKWDFLLVVEALFVNPKGYDELDITDTMRMKKSEILEGIKNYAIETESNPPTKAYYKIDIYVGKDLKGLETIFLKNDMTVTTFLTGIGKNKEIASALYTLVRDDISKIIPNWKDKMINSAEKVKFASYKNLVKEMFEE